jgi:regulator of protease activity HflC (stomatin/prohibitin superfamily)
MGSEILAAFLLMIVMLVVAVGVLASALRVVPEYERAVVFRLGRMLGVVGPGLIFIIPFLDQVVRVDLREQVRRIEGETATTQDDSRVTVDAVWGCRVVDPAKAVLEVADSETACQEMSTAVLRSVIAGMPRSAVMREREQVRIQMHARLREILEPWGAR